MTQSVLDGLGPLPQAPGGAPQTPQLDLTQPPAAPAQPAPDPHRAFGDHATTRRLIYDNVRTAASAMPSVANSRHTLALQDVDYHGPESFSIADQKNAILGRGSPGRRLRGTFVLSTNDGKELARRRVTLATVPHLTDRGTFIHGGNEYTMAHQLRLRPGIFTREKANGEIESHINVAKGLGHRVSLDPKSNVFTMTIGQANIPLFPLLKAMGVSESQMREAWGNEITAANMAKDDPRKINNLYKKLVRHGDPNAPEDQKLQSVKDVFEKMELDPEVTKRTLGQPYTKVGPETFMAVTQKLIGVNRGEHEVDDRDDLAYQQIVGPEDVFAERLKKTQDVLRKVLWRASAKGSLDHVSAGLLDNHLKGALLQTGLGMPLEEINPADVFDQQVRATRMGEGGLSADAIPEESRAVQPSQLGFIDFLRTPECYDQHTEVMLQRGWTKWQDVREDDLFACLIDGHLEFHRAEKLYRAQYEGPMYGCHTGRISYLVTPNHRMWVSPMFKGAQYRIEPVYDTHNSFRRVCSGGFAPWTGGDQDYFEVPRPEHFSNNRSAIVERVPIGPWAELVGWYLGEGSSTYVEEAAQYYVKITQSREANPDNCRQIERLLRELPFAWNYSDRAFVLATKQLAAYFKPMGPSPYRRIPDYLMTAPLHARQRLFDALLRGEGRYDRCGVRTQFCTSSVELADDFVRLAFSLGYATRRVWEKDERPQSSTGGCYVVHIHKQNEHQLLPNRKGASDFFVKDYCGEVFCATVPGGLLYVRRFGGDEAMVGFWCGNSGKVGVDFRLARNARKGSDGRLYTQVVPWQGGKPSGTATYLTPQALSDSVLAFPGEMRRNTPWVTALVNGKVRNVKRDTVNYELPHMEHTFSPLGNMVPLKSMVKGQRAVMAARMLTQALPLIEPEAPLVQSGIPDQPGKSYEEDYAQHMGVLRASAPGRVTAVDGSGITVQYADGRREVHELYNNFPFNRKTFLHQTPVVRPGDVVQSGQLMAHSNFTDKQGTTALGKNLRVAYLPYQGKNFEDAVVISRSAAKRLASEHMYQHGLDLEDESVIAGKGFFRSMFPGKYDKKLLENFDDNGVVKPGTVVQPGEPLILAARKRPSTAKAVARTATPMDASITWDHHNPGVVTDVDTTGKGINVVVKSTAEMQVGDKLSGRYGDKGVIADIIDDERMPHSSDGQPFEVLLNPLGIISRTNPAQIVETALGKIAAKTGKPYKIPDFDNDKDMVEWAINELQKHGTSDLEDVIDPETGRKIPGILTGSRFMMKLHHTSESKAQGRGLGAYTSEHTPAKGGEEGAKRLGILEVNALLSHGATEVLRDARLLRGQANPEYWSQFMQGNKPAVPKIPFTYEKFVNQLQAAGIHPVRQNHRTQIMALTSKDVDALTQGRELRGVPDGRGGMTLDTVNWKDLSPVEGGLFDQRLTGGHNGKLWSHIRLHEPMPNPVMEEPIRRMLNLTEQQFQDVLAGHEKINGLSGPKAIGAALAHINIDKELESCRQEIASGKKTARDKAVRRLGYLKSAKAMGLEPRDWMLDKVPVLPPAFRPVSTMGAKKLPLVDDANHLYKEVFDANNLLRQASQHLGDHIGDERLAVYNAFKGVTGLGDPIHPKNQDKKVQGILKHVFGVNPKLGMVQRQLLGGTMDLVGRAVITPDPDLDMDSVGLPEAKAWEIYKPFVVRNLKRSGLQATRAGELIEARSETARKALVEEMGKRPIIINRAPTLHRYGLMAAWPRLIKGDVMKLSPLICSGFNADFDGDAMQFHVPGTDEAAEEAVAKMLPSRNLFAVSNFRINFVPQKEYIGGIYEASGAIDKQNAPLHFATTADAIRAYRQGRINVDRRIVVHDR